MNFLSSLLARSGGAPPGYDLGSASPTGLYTIYYGSHKKDDNSPVTVFHFDALLHPNQLQLAKNSLRKLTTIRHPNILRLIHSTESDTALWIITEPVQSLASFPLDQLSEESKIYGLTHLITALSFLNHEAQAIHANVNLASVWVTPAGEWKLGGMELCTKKAEQDQPLWSGLGDSMPTSRDYSSPEVRKSGWSVLRDLDCSALDSYHLHLFLYSLFNGPLPPGLSSTPTLPNVRGKFPTVLFPLWRRLGNPNPRARLSTKDLLILGAGSESTGAGWCTANRLVKLSAALEGFSLASEGDRLSLLRSLDNPSPALPPTFAQYKVLPSLVSAFEFGGSFSALLPLLLGLAKTLRLGKEEYAKVVTGPLVRMFGTPDRAMRMALLDGLSKFEENLTEKDVSEKIWPHLLTGFSDVVPVIREATVKSILLLAPKLSSKILNNDLLRHLAKTQSDPEPGIRTNTCILLGRLSPHLQPSTNRKVLVPAFSRALRDPFPPARMASLRALMVTGDCFALEDLTSKLLPVLSGSLGDPERGVRELGFEAVELFVKKCRELTKDFPDTVQPESGLVVPTQVGGMQAANGNGATTPGGGVALGAAGAAGALAGWAFASVSKQLSALELQAPITSSNALSVAPSTARQSNGVAQSATGTEQAGMPGAIDDSWSNMDDMGEEEARDATWGGDLMDVNEDQGDWDEFECAPAPVLSTKKTVPKKTGGKTLKLGGASSKIRIPLDMDASDNWDLEEDWNKPVVAPRIVKKPTPRPVVPTVGKTPQSAPAVPITPTASSTTAPSAPRPAVKPVAAVRPTPVVIPSPIPSAPVPASAPASSAASSNPTSHVSSPALASASSLGEEGPGEELTKEEKMKQLREERRKRMAKARQSVA